MKKCSYCNMTQIMEYFKKKWNTLKKKKKKSFINKNMLEIY